MIKYIASDDDKERVRIRKSVVSATAWLMSAVLVMFLANVILNIVQVPTPLLKKEKNNVRFH